MELNGEVIWDKTHEGRFPESKELKRLVRNILDPDKDLGHSDDGEKEKPEKAAAEEQQSRPSPFEDMSDEEAEEMRQFFGVM